MRKSCQIQASINGENLSKPPRKVRKMVSSAMDPTMQTHSPGEMKKDDGIEMFVRTI